MNTTWKLSVVGIAALLVGGVAGGTGCTSSSDDSSATDDASTTDDTSGGDDASTADTAQGDDTSSCSATAQCPIVGSSGGVTFDNMCGACDTCVASMCCDVTTTCFTPTDGSESDCASLADCEIACANSDAGTDDDGGSACTDACESAYGGDQQAVTDFHAFLDCYQGPCSNSCQ